MSSQAMFDVTCREESQGQRRAGEKMFPPFPSYSPTTSTHCDIICEPTEMEINLPQLALTRKSFLITQVSFSVSFHSDSSSERLMEISQTFLNPKPLC